MVMFQFIYLKLIKIQEGRDFRKTVNQRVSRKEATGVQLRIRVKIETL